MESSNWNRVWLVAALAVLSLEVIPAPGADAFAGPASPLEVAAASDLRFAFEELAPMFEQRHRATVRFSFGSSGQLATQIEQGAPFDVFFSANEGFVHALAGKRLVLPQSVQLYAIGRIVLWVRTASSLEPRDGLAVVLDERVRFIAIANPEHAPYGQAAVQALRSAGLHEKARSRFVLGENVSQTLQFVQSGNADVGIVALSLALAPSVRQGGRYWLIPAYLHRPIRQAAGVLAASPRRELGSTFLTFVNGPEGRPVMRRYGFALPGEGP